MAVASAYILRCKGVLLVQALITLTAWLMLSLAVLSCAQPAPLATPDIPATVAAQVAERMAAIPTVAADPVATPAPTYTPYPTPTLASTATPYPTATPRPTYTPYPTPTALPTYTPYPIPTPEPIPTATPLPTIAAGAIRSTPVEVVEDGPHTYTVSGTVYTASIGCSFLNSANQTFTLSAILTYLYWDGTTEVVDYGDIATLTNYPAQRYSAQVALNSIRNGKSANGVAIRLYIKEQGTSEGFNVAFWF